MDDDLRAPTLDPELLAVLRCPVALRDGQPGRLELVQGGWWLYAPDTGCKYPIRAGVPSLLPNTGLHWREIDLDKLPIPPTPEED